MMSDKTASPDRVDPLAVPAVGTVTQSETGEFATTTVG
jgi:hypothetical protein